MTGHVYPRRGASTPGTNSGSFASRNHAAPGNSVSLARSSSEDPREDFRVVDGECLNCGHYDDHEFCEFCSPTCTECGQEREDVDASLCSYCQAREDENDYFEDEDEGDEY